MKYRNVLVKASFGGKKQKMTDIMYAAVNALTVRMGLESTHMLFPDCIQLLGLSIMFWKPLSRWFLSIWTVTANITVTFVAMVEIQTP